MNIIGKERKKPQINMDQFIFSKLKREKSTSKEVINTLKAEAVKGLPSYQTCNNHSFKDLSIQDRE